MKKILSTFIAVYISNFCLGQIFSCEGQKNTADYLQAISVSVDLNPFGININTALIEGEYGVWLGCGNSTITKPLIIIEGFDINDGFNEQGYYNTFNSNGGLANCLRGEGYDIIILDFDDGATYIEANALLTVELIKEINQQLIANGSNEKLKVMGYSMGGLIARFALGYMETNNINHNTDLYISYDVPNQGANVPIGLQHFADFLDGITIVNPFAPVVNVNLVANFLFPAAKQMAVNYYTINTLRPIFLANLQAVGSYPAQPKKIAIANGSGVNNIQTNSSNIAFQAGDKMIDWTGSVGLFSIDTDIWSTPGTNTGLVYRGLFFQGFVPVNTSFRFLPPNFPPIDNSPGGYYDLTTFNLDVIADAITQNTLGSFDIIHDRFSFVPTVSALDIQIPNNYHLNIQNLSSYPNFNSSISPFETVYADEVDNTEHIDMTEGIAGFLLKELNSSASNYFLQNITETTTLEYQAQSTITTGFDITNSEPNGNYIVAANANVSFEAGEEIVFEPGTEIYGEMQACIVPELDCEGSGKTDWQSETPTETEQPNAETDPDIRQGDAIGEVTFILYPNPNNGLFRIEASEPAIVNIYSILGRKMEQFQVTHSTFQVDLTKYGKGIYLVKAVVGEQVFTEKVVVE